MRVTSSPGLLRCLAVALSCAAAGSTASVAHAGTVTVTPVEYPDVKGSGPGSGALVDVVADPGDADDLEVTSLPGGETLFRDPAGVAAGAGCTTGVDSTTARCPAGQVSIALADGDDRLRVDGPFVGRISAGPGDDRVDAKRTATVDGGAGDDVLVTTGTALGGPGADDLQAAAVSYADHDAPVSADRDGLPDDGAPGEGDRIAPTTGSIDGGRGADELSGAGAATPVTLRGGGGDDRLTGTPAADALSGDGGVDTLVGGGGDDSLLVGSEPSDGPGPERADGGPGADTLRGSPGRDVLDGGPGGDRIDGDGGGDELRARDGTLDVVACSSRADSAVLDSSDVALGCRRITRSAPGTPRVVAFALDPFARLATFDLQLACSQDQRGGCTIAVRVEHRSRVVARRRIRVAAGTFGAGATVRRADDADLPRCPARLTLVTSFRDTAGRARSRRQVLRFATDPERGRCVGGLALPEALAPG